MRMQRIDSARGVKIAVLFLRGADAGNELIEKRVELRIGLGAQRIRRAFDHFENIAIVVWILGRGFIRERFAAEDGGSTVEIVEVARFFELDEGRGNSRFAIDLDTRSPEIVVKMDRG